MARVLEVPRVSFRPLREAVVKGTKALERVLLVRPDGIGDQILCLPVASALRRAFPDCRIEFLSSPAAAPLFENHPDIDGVPICRGNELLVDLVKLFRGGYDATVFLKPNCRLIMAAFLARVPVRVATGYRWYSVFVNRRVNEHRHTFSKHESEYNLNLLKGFGFDPGPLAPPRLVVTKGERDAALAALGTERPTRVVIHPGGRTTRRWKSQHYGKLAAYLANQGFGIVFTGNAAEREEFLAENRSLHTAQNGILNLMAKLTLRELMGVIAVSDAVVSGSTGAAHMAAALGVPSVSLFDPRRMSAPIRWRPLGKGVVLKPAVPECPRCLFAACPHWDCLDRITVDEVATRVHQVTKRAESLTVLQI
jgi:heptosyltransferase-3